MERKACVTINVGAKKPAPSVTPSITPKTPKPSVIPSVTPKVSTAWAPVLMSVLAGIGLAVVGMMLWPEE